MHRLFLASLLALPFVLVLSSSGCTDQACIQWGEDEGPCPSRSEAIKYMIPATNCSGGKVISVDSEGDFDGQACCYDVTNREDDDPFACDTTVGVGPTGATAVTTGVGTGGSPPFCTGATCSPECNPPVETPSQGSCLVIDNFTAFCNPMTNEGCFEGGSCDLAFDGFSSMVMTCTSSFFTSACSSCFAPGECATGLACLSVCAKYCCDDGDCGSAARCSFEHFAQFGFPQLGVCVNADGGAGGMGGAGAAGGMGGAGGAGGI